MELSTRNKEITFGGRLSFEWNGLLGGKKVAPSGMIHQEEGSAFGGMVHRENRNCYGRKLHLLAGQCSWKKVWSGWKLTHSG